jgi:flagellar motor switch protein FliM
VKVVRRHDFRRSEGVDRGFVRALHVVFDAFGRYGAIELSSLLRRPCQVTFSGVLELSWQEVTTRLGDRPYLATFTLSSFVGQGALVTQLDTAMRMLELRLGGANASLYPSHYEPTDTDYGVLGPIFQGIIGEFGKRLSRIRETTATIVGQDSNSQFVPLANPTDMCLLVRFDLSLGQEAGGSLDLVLPFALVRLIIEAMRSARMPQVEDDIRTVSREQVMMVPLRVTLEIPSIELMADEIASLAPGDVLRLYHPLDRPIDVRAERVLLARARQGQSGSRIACSVVEEVFES